MAAAKPRLAKALWDYVGNEAGDLTFQAGEAIKCTSMESDGGWWTGETRDGQIGQFPSNYVKLVEQKTGNAASSAAATTNPAAAAAAGASAQAAQAAQAVQAVQGGAAPKEASSITPAASTPAAAAGGQAPQNRAGSGGGGEEKEQKVGSAAPVAANVSEVWVGVSEVCPVW